MLLALHGGVMTGTCSCQVQMMMTDGANICVAVALLHNTDCNDEAE